MIEIIAGILTGRPLQVVTTLFLQGALSTCCGVKVDLEQSI
jgi:hypothetical protein